jgi:hypothetical protein
MVASDHLNFEARNYSSLRLAADYSNANSAAEKDGIVASVANLSNIYAILKNVSDSVIPAPIKAMLANLLVSRWQNSPEQEDALRKGLGLASADEYWSQLGKNSAALPPKAKIQLLADLIAETGVNPKVKDLPSLLESVLEILRVRFADVEEKALQIYAAELVISDYLKSPKSSSDRVLRFVQTIDAQVIRQALIVEPKPTTTQ